ncbi:MAG: hypothetical protein KDA83_18600 [Planctomycetales bacterium]|nr:hypothetical protein [Planctomycetales bacterium]
MNLGQRNTSRSRAYDVRHWAMASAIALLGVITALPVLQAKETPVPSGPSTLITNQVHDRADQTGLHAGSVTVRWYPESGTLLFDSATTDNGWIAEVVKNGGSSNGDRVIVVFDHPELGGSVKFQMEPGKLDIR